MCIPPLLGHPDAWLGSKSRHPYSLGSRDAHIFPLLVNRALGESYAPYTLDICRMTSSDMAWRPYDQHHLVEREISAKQSTQSHGVQDTRDTELTFCWMKAYHCARGESFLPLEAYATRDNSIPLFTSRTWSPKLSAPSGTNGYWIGVLQIACGDVTRHVWTDYIRRIS
jgi:hypothetical protein